MSPSVSVARLPQPLPSISLPQHEILEGTPDARAVFTAHSADQGASAGFWSCDVGRYEFLFDYDEFIYLIEGEVVVEQTIPTKATFVLQAGDTAHFPQGVTTIWEVKRRMTKYFVARVQF
jgi:uncharacterized cupin superfamily protein